MNTAGWLLTESGRQPWIVQGLMKTSQAASPSVTTTDLWISLIAFVLLYLSLGVADVYLMIHYGRQELEPGANEGPDASDSGGGDAGSDQPPPDTLAEPDEDRVPALIY
jgi:cytochrome bd-type quinol oxidase subunit 1